MLRRLLALLAIVWLPAAARALPIPVVLIGDSITAGQMSMPVGPSYASLLAASLGSGFQVSNIGCGGTSSLDWTLSQPGAICGPMLVGPNLYEGLARPLMPASFVSVLLGTNDALGFFEPAPVPPERYRDAIAELTSNLLADGAGHVLLMTPPPNFVHPLMDTLGAYRGHILELCGTPDDAVLCGPDVFSLLGPLDFGLDIHPNAFGHQKIADALEDAILAAIPEPGSAPLLALGLALAARGRRAARRRLRLRARRAGRRAAD
jgi:lysophospholipase L1-like esterase